VKPTVPLALTLLLGGALATGTPATGAGAASGHASSAAAASSKPAADCQPYSSTPCLLPFPDNRLTRPDRTSPTGLRVDLPQNAMPKNKAGQRVDPTQYNRNDGFSPGSAMIVHVPGLDNAKAFAKTGAVGLLNMSRAFAKGQPIVVIDERTGRRQLIYSLLDANAPDPQDTNLMIVPGRELAEGHTYVVALRDLRNSRGKVISAPGWFEKLRDRRALPTSERAQKTRYARIFAALKRAGIARNKELYEAWDFTVASEHGLTYRLLSIRNNAFAQLGDRNLADRKVQGNAPVFTVTRTKQLSPQLRDVQGQFVVPCYLDTCGAAGFTGFHYSSSAPDAPPTQIPGNEATALFECIVPTSASPSHRARISLYGHGLLGSRTEVESKWVVALAVQHNMVFCATDWWGLAEGDIPLALATAANLNLFPVIADRLQQGVVNTLYLGRLLLNPKGFASNTNFQSAGRPLIDTSRLYYYGNSQGGIEGGLTTAVSPDIFRSVIGVTGIDYGNMLIERSTDFTPFKNILLQNYPDRSMYPVEADVLQQLWDRGDPDGYAQHMTTRPLPDTPRHTVLMQIAYGDFQVTMYAGAAEARTIGARAYEPALDRDRARDHNLFYEIPTIARFPFGGSAIVIWDSGPGRVQPPPAGNIPPTAGAHNIDPHEDPRDTPAAQRQISAFLEPNGEVVDVCGGRPCHSYDFTR